MGLFPDTQNRGLRMRRECRERFPRHRLQRKPLVNDPGMHHGTCVTHVPRCTSGSLNCGGGGKRSRYYRRMRNSQFYVSGKRPIREYGYNFLLQIVLRSVRTAMQMSPNVEFVTCTFIWQPISLVKVSKDGRLPQRLLPVFFKQVSNSV